MVAEKPYNTLTNFEEIILSLRHKYSLLHANKYVALTIPAIPFLGTKSYKK